MKNACLYADPLQQDGKQGAACDIENGPDPFDSQAIIVIEKKITAWRIHEVEEKIHDRVLGTVHDVVQVENIAAQRIIQHAGHR